MPAEKNNFRTIGDWEQVFNAISDPIFIQDAENTIIRANASFARIFKAEPADLIGKKCYELMHKLNQPWPECPAEKTKEDRNPHTEEVNDPNIGKVLLVTTSPIFDEEGQLKAVVHVSKDISAQKRQEEILRESEERYRTLVENLNIGVYRNTLGPKGHFLQANPAMVKMFGYGSAQEFLLINVSDLYHDPKKREFFVEEITQKGALRAKELRLKKKDGTFFWCAVTAQVKRDESGNIEWIDGIIEDINERKLLEEESKGKMDALERFQKVTVGRELKMKELKERIAELEAKSGEK